MRILLLSNRLPWPLKDGGAIATFQFLRGYADQDCEVTLLAMNTSKHYTDENEWLPVLGKYANVITVTIDNHVKLGEALLNIFTKKSYHVQRFISRSFSLKLAAILQSANFDLIHFDGLYVTPYLNVVKKYSRAVTVLRTHNVEFQIWERLAKNMHSPLKKKYLNLQTMRLKKYETAMYNRFDCIAAISDNDKITIRENGCQKPVYVIPTGINLSDYHFNPESADKKSFFHIGAMDWMPNIEAINNLLKNIWPLILEKYPDSKLYLAGRKMPDAIQNFNAQNVINAGEVDNALEFIRSKEIMLVPLLSGGGMRIKIMEGMALGKVIISTSVGAEGIPYTIGKNILIADSPAEFVQAVTQCYSTPGFIANMGSEARKLAEVYFDNRKLTSQWLEFYKTLS